MINMKQCDDNPDVLEVMFGSDQDSSLPQSFPFQLHYVSYSTVSSLNVTYYQDG